MSGGAPTDRLDETSRRATGVPTILVTGGSGFLGAALTEALAGRGDHVIAMDVRIGEALGRLAAAHENVTPVVADLTEWASIADLFRAHRVDSVIHCGAIVGVIASVDHPFNTMRVNVEGTVNLLECMRLFGARRMVQISSEEVYGDFRSARIDEEHPRNPVQAYGISKVACEQFARSYAARYGLECIAVRTSWVYGANLPRERVPRNLLSAIVDGRSCHVPAGADALIDHTYVDDFVAGVLLAHDHPRHRFDAYHVTSGQAVTVQGIVDVLKELAPGADIGVGPGAYFHGPGVAAVRKGALDVSRARAELGYRPRHDIRSGLQRCLDLMTRSRKERTR